MVGLAIEFSLVVGWFLWLHRRQVQDRVRRRRLPWRQMRFGFADERAGEG